MSHEQNDILYDQLKDMQAETDSMLDTIKQDTDLLCELVRNTFNTIHDTQKNFKKVADLKAEVKKTINEITK